MDDRTKSQIALILEHETDTAFRRAHDKNQATIASHAAKGMLQSGGTIKRAASVASEIAHNLLENLLPKVAELEKSEAAFLMLRSAFEKFTDRLEVEELHYIARIASGRGKQLPDKSIWDATLREFGKHKTDLARKLEIARFDFAENDNGSAKSAAPSTTMLAGSEKKNPGGKPLARHWDAMWAAISVQLWTGDLKPKSQADLKVVMFAWFNAAEIEIGDTAVTQRARQLWQAMQNAES